VLFSTQKCRKFYKGHPFSQQRVEAQISLQYFVWIKYPTLLSKRPISGLGRPWPGPTCGTLGLDIQLPVISIWRLLDITGSWHTGGSCWVGGHLLKIRLWFSASMTDCVFKFSLDLKSHWLHEFLGLVISISKVARYNRVASLMQDHLLPWHAGHPVYEPCKTRAILDMSRDLWLWLYILMVPMDSEKLSGALWQFRVSFRPEIMTTRFTLDLKSHWLKEIQGLDIQLIISISKVARYNGSLTHRRKLKSPNPEEQ